MVYLKRNLVGKRAGLLAGLPGSLFASLFIGAVLSGCGAPPAPKSEAKSGLVAMQQAFTPYVPPPQPAPELVTQDLPTSPRDAKPAVSLVYTVELWEILLPRNTISSDEAFWKRVNEQAVDLPTYTVLFNNGFRVGELPIEELDKLRTLIDDRKGKRTNVNGIAGKLIEIPIQSGLPNQTLFYFNRSNQLIGRTYDRCENLMYFSFETTPRQPDQIRLNLTPAVRMMNKRLQFFTTPGRLEQVIDYRAEEVRYDANLNLDLPLRSVLVIAPSIEARDSTTLGGAFLIRNAASEQLERLIVIVPRAFTRNDETASN